MTQSTLPLIRSIIGTAVEWLTIEASLAGAELKESARAASSALTMIFAGAALLFGGTIILLVAVGYFLMRFGVPPDMSFLIVAALTLIIGGGLLRAGAKELSLSRLVPHRSLAQISAILAGR
jgi:hypothetical protein